MPFGSPCAARRRSSLSVRDELDTLKQELDASKQELDASKKEQAELVDRWAQAAAARFES